MSLQPVESSLGHVVLQSHVHIGRVLCLDIAEDLEELLLGVLLVGPADVRPVGEETVEADLDGLQVGEVVQEVTHELLWRQ